MTGNHSQWLQPQKVPVLHYRIFWNNKFCHKNTKWTVSTFCVEPLWQNMVPKVQIWGFYGPSRAMENAEFLSRLLIFTNLLYLFQGIYFQS